MSVYFSKFTLLIKSKNGPNNTSLATASKTRLAPIKLFKLALNVAKSTPIAIIGGQTLRLLMKLQSCNNIVVSQVIAVRSDTRDNMDKVKKQAPNVPLGILLLGAINSPDILAPDIIPVTPENKTPKTMKKFNCTSLGSSAEQSLTYFGYRFWFSKDIIEEL